MESLTYFLAFARLARVQCVTLGHPVTSGIPTIDYFLSCGSPRACGRRRTLHGASRSVCQLAALFIRTADHRNPPLSRGNFPLPCDTRWYVCHQTLFKIHPDFDRIIGEILRRDPKGIAVFFTGQQPDWTSLLQERLRVSLSDHTSRVYFLPRMPYEEYLGFLRLADVLIDSVHFSAGTTTYHALALGVPLVTLPGAFARGRGTAAVYRRIGVFDCIAQSPEDYVRRAVMIAKDRSLRDSIGATLRDRVGMLFSNRAAHQEMEAFFLDSVPAARLRAA